MTAANRSRRWAPALGRATGAALPLGAAGEAALLPGERLTPLRLAGTAHTGPARARWGWAVGQTH